MSKFFSDSGSKLVGQEMFKVLDRAKELERLGNEVIHLELGQPRFDPPVDLIPSTIRSLSNKNVGYCSSYGLYSLREKILNKNIKINSNLTIDNILISTANLLISQILHLCCNQNDKVVVFSPTFPTYIASACFFNIELIQIPLSLNNKFQLTKNDIDKAIKFNPKMIIINSANNPTGAVYDEDVLRYLNDLSIKNNIWILSDETYAQIAYHKNFYSTLNFENKNLITISSFSKVYSIPGFRVGYVIANNDVIDKLALSCSTLISCLPIFTQEGIERVIENDEIYIQKMNKNLLDIITDVVNLFEESILLKSQYTSPQSAYYMFLNISQTGLNDIEFCNELLNKFYVACTPGSSFGDHFNSYVRLSLCGNYEAVTDGVKRIINFIETFKKI
jgi:aspartate/methionine/tyrosine aminotransferase